jgi:integrative and conjugative element protein (TIGR02256 family)
MFRAHELDLVLKIDAAALASLVAYSQLRPRDDEAGGVLLGRWLEGASSFVVDAISEPQPEDRRTRTSFFRSYRGHTQIIADNLRASRDTRGYLGEWHTHPEPVPKPSRIDRRDWCRRLHCDRVELPWVFFIIVGTAEICAWTGAPGRGRQRLWRLERQPSQSAK